MEGNAMQRRLMGLNEFAAIGLLFAIWVGAQFSAAAQTPAGVPSGDRPAEPQAQTAPVSDRSADIFDSAADAKAQIATALEAAQREHQRVLLLLGGNWCTWCHRLHTLFKENKDVARLLKSEYQLVPVDVGRFDKNTDIVSGYGLELKKTGVPFLVVLDSDGKVLAKQETGSLEKGQAHDPDKVLAFLTKWKAEPRDAETVVTQALARATAEHKSILLRLQAPWCVWCRRLEAFLSRPEIEPLIGRDFVDLKIDMERMTHAKEVAARFCEKDAPGMPWLAVLDAEGKVVVTSDGPDGNIGCPVAPGEISHFMEMLRKGAKKLSAGDLQKIEDLLKEAAAKFKPAASTQP